MLAYFCLLAFIGLGSCSEIEKVMPTRYEIENSINRTIEEVERLVQENPSLPKLSRNDIVNILYNITSKDVHSLEDEALVALQKTREDYQRALMVVLPYKPKESEDIGKLYEKPPMVQYFADEAVDSEIVTAPTPSVYSNAQQSENLIENKQQLLTAYMRFDESKRSTTTERIETTPTSTTTTTTKSPLNSISDSSPEKFTFNLGSLDQKAEASHSSVGTRRPIYKGTFSRYRTSTRAPSRQEISTTPKTTTTTDAITESTTVTMKPVQSILSSDQWRYNAPPTKLTTTTTIASTKIPEKVYDSPWKPMSPSKGFFVPTVESASDSAEEPDFSVLKEEDFQKVMESTTSTTTRRPAPIFVTPSVTTLQKKVKPSTVSVTTTTITPSTMRGEVAELLKSIGLQPMKPSKQNELKLSTNNVATQLNAYLDDKNQDLKQNIVKSTASSKLNTFAAPVDVKEGVKNLSPDIQLLFQQFGLQANGKQNVFTTTTTTPKPTTRAHANSYTHFKPLPTSSVRDLDFRNFLARFGLGVGEARNQKAMQPKPVTERPSLIEAVPENMKKILENIGLVGKVPKSYVHRPVVTTEIPRVIVRSTTPSIEHIFKPHEIPVNDKARNEKIKNLLNTVKMVQEGKAGIQDVQKVAHDLLQSTKSLENGPDPLKLEEILSNYRSSLKNEVKRQEEKTTTTTTTTASTPRAEMDQTTFSSIATTDSSGSFSELSESSTTANDDTKTKIDQSSSASDSESSKPSFFDTFDVDDFLKKASTTETPSSESTKKPNFFDTFDVDAFINKTESEDSAKSATPSITDLEDSFGGSTPEPDPVLPTRPKTGLYFLVDWNSFLEVGEDGKEKVNLRFQPNAGDRTRFIPVKVP